MKIKENLYFYQGTTGLKVGIGAGSSNITIITGKKQVMIDTGEPFRKLIKKLRNNMALDNIIIEDTQLILPTHSHWDHMNAINKIKKLSDAEFFTHPVDVPKFEDPNEEFNTMMKIDPEFKSAFTSLPAFMAKFFFGVFMGKRKSVEVDGTLTDDQVIENGPVTIQVIFTPGHAQGHISYYIPERKALIAGDIIDRELGLGGSINNPISSYLDSLSSIRKLQALDVDLYISGHGELVEGKENVEEFINSNLKKSETLPQRMLDIIIENGSKIPELVEILYPDIPFAQKYMKKMEIMLILKYLESNKKVRKEKHKKKLIWYKN